MNLPSRQDRLDPALGSRIASAIPGLGAGLIVLFVATLLTTVASRPIFARAPVGPSAVAVLYFDNNTGDARWDPLQRGLADMMVTDLAGTPGLQVVEREKLQALLAELKLQHSRAFDPSTAQRLGKLLGARYAVTGAIAAIAPQVRIDVRLVDVRTARVIMTEHETGPADDFFAIEQRLVARFRASLADLGAGRKAGSASEAASDVAGTSRPAQGPGLKDVLRYGEALSAADAGDLDTAQRKLTALVGTAPHFSLARDRYLKVMKALALARASRVRGLDDAATQLDAKIGEVLAAAPDKLEPAALGRYLGYRVLRGAVWMTAVRQLVDLRSATVAPQVIAATDHKRALTAARGWLDNTDAFRREIRLVRPIAPGAPVFVQTTVDPADAQRAQELGLGGQMPVSATMWLGASETTLLIALARFALLGEIPQETGLMGVITPVPATLDPSLSKRAEAWLDSAAQAVRDDPSPMVASRRPQLAGEIADARARWLLRRGDLAGAIAAWQSFMTAWPTHPDFARFEQRVTEALGATDAAQTLVAAREAWPAAFAGCSRDPIRVAFMAVYKALVARKDWVREPYALVELQRMTDELRRACSAKKDFSRVAAVPFAVAKAVAVLHRDCGWLAVMQASLPAGDPTGVALAAEHTRLHCRR